jgi:hypothetical protein
MKMANAIEHTCECDTRYPGGTRGGRGTNIHNIRQNFLWNLNVISKRAAHGGSKDTRGYLVAILNHERNQARNARVEGDPLLSNDTELIITTEVSDLRVILGDVLGDLPSVEASEGASQPGTLSCEAIQHHTFSKRSAIIAALCHTV